MGDSLANLRTRLKYLPSLPTTVAKTIEICDNPNTSAADLKRVISVDPVLAGKVMTLVNSAFYGLASKYTSLLRAIVMLGVNTVKNLVLSTAMLGVFGNPAGGPLQMKDFWQHSLAVGVLCRELAKKHGIAARHLEEYFVAGLLHDLGKVVLAQAMPAEYRQALAVAGEQKLPLFKAEKLHVGWDHIEVGKLLTQEWRLGHAISSGIIHHHSPDGSKFGFALLTYVANYLAYENGFGSAGDTYPVPPATEELDRVGASEHRVKETEADIRTSVADAQVFLAVAQG